MKNISKIVLVSSLLFAQAAFAEDINVIFKKVNDLIAAKNYSKALDELNWAKKEVEKLHFTQVQSFLPDQLNGYTGNKIQANSALGFINLEREYKKTGENSSVKISLTGGTGAAGGAGLGGLAALGQMAAMMGGNQPGMETVRIAGRTATLEVNEDSKRAELTIFLNSGSILKLEMPDGTKGEVLKKMAEEIKLDDLDAYLKG